MFKAFFNIYALNNFHHFFLTQSDETMEWKVIKPDVFAAIMDFFTSGLPVVNEDSKPSADTGKDVCARPTAKSK